LHVNGTPYSANFEQKVTFSSLTLSAKHTGPDVHKSPCYQRKRGRDLQGAHFLIWAEKGNQKDG
jgi:hypothetical protein